jgi:hypothetical protein
MTTATWTLTEGRAMWNGELLDHWSDVLAAELVQMFDPAEVWLFGSVARGKRRLVTGLAVRGQAGGEEQVGSPQYVVVAGRHLALRYQSAGQRAAA